MSIWLDNHLKVFISHVSSHKVLAAQIKTAFEDDGISGFVAHDDIEPAKAWQDVIENALGSCDAVIALLSPDFHASNWTDQEVGIAIGRGIPVLSIRYGLDPYGFIGKYQGYPAIGKSGVQIATEVANILISDPRTAMKMTNALINKFAGSDSWADAKRRMKRLESVTQLDASLATLLRAAAANNGQISTAWGVPQSISALTARFGIP